MILIVPSLVSTSVTRKPLKLVRLGYRFYFGLVPFFEFGNCFYFIKIWLLVPVVSGFLKE